MLSRIVPCLWFDAQAEEAAQFYTAIFPRSRIVDIARYPEAGQEIHGRPAGSVMQVSFELEGQAFSAINGGPRFRFTEALSLEVRCETQAEVDHYWERLGAGGDPAAQQCGWLKDRYGLSWQIVPNILGPLLDDRDRPRAARVMTALLGMQKLDIARLMSA